MQFLILRGQMTLCWPADRQVLQINMPGLERFLIRYGRKGLMNEWLEELCGVGSGNKLYRLNEFVDFWQ